MTCQALAAALPDSFNWLLAIAVFGPVVAGLKLALNFGLDLVAALLHERLRLCATHGVSRYV